MKRGHGIPTGDYRTPCSHTNSQPGLRACPRFGSAVPVYEFRTPRSLKPFPLRSTAIQLPSQHLILLRCVGIAKALQLGIDNATLLQRHAGRRQMQR